MFRRSYIGGEEESAHVLVFVERHNVQGLCCGFLYVSNVCFLSALDFK